VDRDEKQATLLLHGWVAIRAHKGSLTGWGMHHALHGDVREDFYNNAHGPTVAPLTWYRTIVPYDMEIPFDEIPDHTFGRLWLWWFAGMPVEKHDGTL